MLILLVVVYCLIWLFTLRWKRRDLEALYKQMKISAPRLPLIGHLYLFFCSDEGRMKQIQRLGREVINCGGIAGLWVAHKLYIHVADSEVADILMKSCLEKDDLIKCFHLVTGDGSVFTSGSLGIGITVQENINHPFPLALEEVMSAMITRVFHPWLYSDFVYKLLPRYQNIKRHISTVCEMLQKISISMDNGLKTFITLLIESPSNISDIAIREECIVMIAAASDTSAVSLGYITLMLARYSEEQEKIYDELKEVIVDLNRPITSEDLPHLKYLDAFIRETLRLYPPVPTIVRKTDRNIELPSGITLVPGCGIMINIWAINRNPLYWGKDAEEFRPARFLETEPRHPAAFVSFSHGPRNCLGYQYAMMSIKTVVATILSQHRIEAATEDLKHEPLRVKYDLMMRHMDNYRVRFEPR